MKCLICENKNVNYYDDYRFNVESDSSYLKNPKIYRCFDCDLSFCYPMPSKSNLNNYYNNIYRAAGRPHEFDIIDVQNNYNSYKNISYLDYLENFINFKNIKKLFDFGSGTGCLGYLIKKKYQSLQIASAENDKYCKKILKNRGYKNYKNIEELKDKFNLIISLHSIEHLTDLEIFEKFKQLSEKNSYIFIEVPNCEINDLYKTRPYDSPHLIFFTKKSFQKIAQKFSFEIIDISYASITITENFKLMQINKNKYQNWRVGKFKDKIKSQIRKFMKNFGLIKQFRNKKKIDFLKNDNNLSNIRVLLKVL